MQQDLIAALVVVILMLVDIVTGYTNAAVHHELNSTKMREGLEKKLGSAIVVLLADYLHIYGGYIGFTGDITNLLPAAVCALIGIMEVTSILENACNLNPGLPFRRVSALFGIEGEEKEE